MKTQKIPVWPRWKPAATTVVAPVGADAAVDTSVHDPADREQLATTLKAAYGFLDLAQLKVRLFRNVLVGLVIFLVVLLGGLTLTGCLVALLGVIGGTLASALSLSGLSESALTRLIDKEATALTSDASPATPAPAKSGGVQPA